jgi:hypothetical protein
MGTLKESVGNWKRAVKPDRPQKHKGGTGKSRHDVDFASLCD